MEWLTEGLIDSARMLPFLFVAFLCMEALEHYSGSRVNRILKKTEKGGPVVGAVLGCIPQCGFSVMAADLYAGSIISLGTLMAVFLATSDEALLIMLANPGNSGEILSLVGVKLVIAIVSGYALDLIFKRRKKMENSMEEICSHCGCHDHHGIIRSALNHTVRIFLYILILTCALAFIMDAVGIQELSRMLLGDTIFQPLIAGVIGLIPNCAASVALTELYLGGAISFASVVSGLCTGAGVGLLVLFRINHSPKENLKILGLLYGIGALSGMVLQLF